MNKILILGGTGRFGTALSNQLKGYDITTLARNERADIRADINTFTDYKGFDIVINCAAMKDVAKCENQVEECVSVNVSGTSASLEAAAKAGVKRYIYISTDMAVDVYSVYGASKKIADAMVVNKSRSSAMECCVVRLGNIISSYGSILTALALKAQELGYSPVTDVNMTRFYMSATDCVNFVISILKSSDVIKGDIFAPRCNSYRITDIAAAVAPDAPIKIIGLRPGDALAITMISGAEMPRTTHTKDGHYRIIPQWSDEVIEPVNIDSLDMLTSANNPRFGSVEELRELYHTLISPRG